MFAIGTSSLHAHNYIKESANATPQQMHGRFNEVHAHTPNFYLHGKRCDIFKGEREQRLTAVIIKNQRYRAKLLRFPTIKFIRSGAGLGQRNACPLRVSVPQVGQCQWLASLSIIAGQRRPPLCCSDENIITRRRRQIQNTARCAHRAWATHHDSLCAPKRKFPDCACVLRRECVCDLDTVIAFKTLTHIKEMRPLRRYELGFYTTFLY